jgi:hypothetical protein
VLDEAVSPWSTPSSLPGAVAATAAGRLAASPRLGPVCARSSAERGGYGLVMKKLLILTILVALGAVASKKLKEL